MDMSKSESVAFIRTSSTIGIASRLKDKGCLGRRLCSTADIFVPHLCLLASKSLCPPGEELCSY